MQQSREQLAIALEGVHVVDVRTGEIRRNMTLTISGTTIAALAAHGSTDTNGVRRIDAHGKFVTPGFLEMHAHVLDAPDPDGYLRVMLSKGITGYRQMSGAYELLAQRTQGPLTPDDLPQALAMPGPILTPLNAPTPEAAAKEVRSQRDAGADFIKVLDMPPPAFIAALDTARSLGIPLAGHLPANVSPEDASTRGMRAIEHLGPRDTLLSGCSCAGHRPTAAPAAPPPMATLSNEERAKLFVRMIANPMLNATPADIERYNRVIDGYDGALCERLAQTFFEHQTWQVPTLIRLHTMEFGDRAAYRSDPALRYVPPTVRDLWESIANDFAARFSPAMRATMERLFALQMGLIAAFRRAHVPMMAGSDLGGQWVVPGFGLHREYGLLHEAGLTALEVLQMTTIDGAVFLGREASLGTVEVGKQADLVLLDADPTADVANLSAIAGVIRNGVYHSRSDLEHMCEAVSARYEDSSLR